MSETVRVPCFCEGNNPSCQLCGGTGTQDKPACPRCKGTGKTGGRACLDCRGRRYLVPIETD